MSILSIIWASKDAAYVFCKKYPELSKQYFVNEFVHFWEENLFVNITLNIWEKLLFLTEIFSWYIYGKLFGGVKKILRSLFWKIIDIHVFIYEHYQQPVLEFLIFSKTQKMV